MVDQAEFDGIADGLRADGIRPSISRMRRALPRGGSPRAVTAAMKIWKQKRGIADWQVDTGLPLDVQAKVDAVTLALWEAARDREAASFDGERERLKGDLALFENRLADAQTLVADLERQLRDLAVENAILKSEAATADVLQRRRSTEYWDRLMREVRSILERNGPSLPAVDILRHIPEHLHRESNYHVERLNLGTLNKKLGGRGTHRRYVTPLPGSDGTWTLRRGTVEDGEARQGSGTEPSAIA